MKNFRSFDDLLDEHLQDKEFAAEFLAYALENEDFETFLTCLKDVMRVHGNMTAIAKDANLSRATLYNLTSKNANPELKTVFTLLRTLGYDLRITKRRGRYAKSS